MVSIMHRVSGALLFLALPLLLWMFELSLISELGFARLARHRLALARRSSSCSCLAWAFFHHLIAGIRYLLLDLHIGVDESRRAHSAIGRLRDQPAADAAGGAQALRSVLMAGLRNLSALVPSALVVGAHYGVGGFLVQRLTAVVLTVRAVAVVVRVSWAAAGYDGWAALFVPLWMKIVTLVALLALSLSRVDRRARYLDGLRQADLGPPDAADADGAVAGACAVWSVQILWRV